MIRVFLVAAACCLAAVLGLPADAAPGAESPASANSASAAVSRYTVTADILNVRGEPSLTAPVIGKLKQGAVVEKLEESGEWFRVRAGELTGWAHSDYLQPADDGTVTGPDEDGLTDAAPPPSNPKAIGRGIRGTASRKPVETETADNAVRTGHVLGDAVRVRTGPGTDYEIEGHLNRGDRVSVIASEGEWYRIETESGLAGWIAAAYIGFRTDGEPAGDALRGRVIVVDPGHGGNDSGTIGTTYGTYEKTLNLSTALLLKRELELRGAVVVMTRAADEEKPSLQERVEIAARSGGDAFVSIHYNSAETKASGILTFYYSAGKDKPLAAAIEHRLAEGGLGLASNGISFGNFHVVRENSLPAVLLELGFLTNERDEGLARTESYQLAAARAIAQGLEDYFASQEERT
jgi:N-acetylmuramoyl-L-alanine amidase